MYRLILLRHAKSAYPHGVDDHDRPLNGRGRANALRIASRLNEFLPADVSVSAAVSTAVRAQQTWSAVNADTRIPYRSDPALYLAEVEVLLEAATTFTTDVGILVGHNPGLEDFARSTSAARSVEDPRTSVRMWEKFPTSAFAVLECATGSWDLRDVECNAFAVCR